VSAPRRARRRRDAAPAARFLPRYRGASTGAGKIDLAAAWRELGSRGAGAIPIRVSRNGVVTVACADAMRAQQIQADADDLRAGLERLAGISLTRLDTVIADHAVQLPDFSPTAPPEVSPAARKAAIEAAEGMTAGIDDPALRDAITRAAAGSIARRWDEMGPD
jgi:hypothetical protein